MCLCIFLNHKWEHIFAKKSILSSSYYDKIEILGVSEETKEYFILGYRHNNKETAIYYENTINEFYKSIPMFEIGDKFIGKSDFYLDELEIGKK